MQQMYPCNQEQVFLKEPEVKRANLDARRKTVAEHTSVANRSLKAPRGWKEWTERVGLFASGPGLLA